MHIIKYLASVGAFLLALSFATPNGVCADRTDDFKKGELLVKFKKGYKGKGAKVIQQFGGKIVEKLSRIDVSRIKLPAGMTIAKAKKKLANLPFLDFAEPNYRQKAADWKPSDTRWGQQWGVTKIHTAPAWSTETGKKDVIIAILDTGVDLDHPDLVGKIVPGLDIVDGDDQANDTEGHGTHCAGIAAAKTNNAKGIAGICPNCSIMPIRVLGPNGGWASDVANGIIWAVDHGAKVISLSLGGYSQSFTQENAIDYAWGKGAVVVAAAGNDGIQDRHYPSFHQNAIAVGATSQYDDRASFSNYGSWVDVAAPGMYIMSTIPDGKYGNKSGTSMSTPFVAGLAGLIYSELGNNATPQKVRTAIETTTDSVGSWLSNGQINVKEAILSVRGQGSSTPTPTKPPVSPPSGNNTVVAGNPDGGISLKSFSRTKGTTLKSPPNSVVRSDDAKLVVRSTTTGKSRFVDFSFGTKFPSHNSVKSIKVILEAKYYASPGPITAYFWNWNSKKWESIAKKNLDVSDTRLTFTTGNAPKYLSKTGKFKVRFYRETKFWQTFDIGADYVRFVPTSGVASVSSKSTTASKNTAQKKSTSKKKTKKAPKKSTNSSQKSGDNPFLKMQPKNQ